MRSIFRGSFLTSLLIAFTLAVFSGACTKAIAQALTATQQGQIQQGCANAAPQNKQACIDSATQIMEQGNQNTTNNYNSTNNSETGNGTCQNSLPNDCPCPSPNCSGDSLANPLSDKTANTDANGQLNPDNRYKYLHLQGPMGNANNTLAVNPTAWFNPDTGSYTDSDNKPYTGPSGSNPCVHCTPLDPGIQGAMPQGVMPMKTTPAMSFVTNFPWLYKDIDQSAQVALYRGGGQIALRI